MRNISSNQDQVQALNDEMQHSSGSDSDSDSNSDSDSGNSSTSDSDSEEEEGILIVLEPCVVLNFHTIQVYVVEKVNFHE